MDVHTGFIICYLLKFPTVTIPSMYIVVRIISRVNTEAGDM